MANRRRKLGIRPGVRRALGVSRKETAKRIKADIETKVTKLSNAGDPY